MNSFDFTMIDEQDPSLGAVYDSRFGLDLMSANLNKYLTWSVVFAAEGHRVLYDREVPFEIRNQIDPHDTAQEVLLSFMDTHGLLDFRRWLILLSNMNIL